MKKFYGFLFPLVLSFAVIWAAAPFFSSGGGESEKEPRRSQPDTSVSVSTVGKAFSSPEKQIYMTARIFEGKLCLFLPQSPERPYAVLDVSEGSLPVADRDMFSLGVDLYSPDEVTRFMEDYTS